MCGHSGGGLRSFGWPARLSLMRPSHGSSPRPLPSTHETSTVCERPDTWSMFVFVRGLSPFVRNPVCSGLYGSGALAVLPRRAIGTLGTYTPSLPYTHHAPPAPFSFASTSACVSGVSVALPSHGVPAGQRR